MTSHEYCVVVIPGAPSQASNGLGMSLSRAGGVPVVGPEGKAWAFFDQSPHAEMLLGGTTPVDRLPGLKTFTGDVVPCSADQSLPVVMLCDEEGVNVTQADRRPGMPLLPSPCVPYAVWAVPLVPEDVYRLIREHPAARGWLREAETFHASALVDGTSLVPHAQVVAPQILVGDPERAECRRFREYLACILDGAGTGPLGAGGPRSGEPRSDLFAQYLSGPYQPIMQPGTESLWTGNGRRVVVFFDYYREPPESCYEMGSSRYAFNRPRSANLEFTEPTSAQAAGTQPVVVWVTPKVLQDESLTALEPSADHEPIIFGEASEVLHASELSIARTEKLLHFWYGQDIARADLGAESKIHVMVTY